MGLGQTEFQNTATGAGLGTMLGGPGVGTAIGAGAGALFGLGDYFLFQKPEQERQLKALAAAQRYSPWTKDSMPFQSGVPANADPLGGMLAQAGVGASLIQQANQAQRQDAMSNAYIEALGRSGGGQAAAAPTGGNGLSSESLLSPYAQPQMPATLEAGPVNPWWYQGGM